MTCNVTCAGEVERRGIFPFGNPENDECIFSIRLVIGNNVQNYIAAPFNKDSIGLL